MGRVKNKDTKPEVHVRSIVHRMGFRFRKNKKNLPGHPDIVLPKYRKIIFIHGCFWHGHKNCKRAKRPSSNSKFWDTKLNRNIERDKINIAKLSSMGWHTMVIWQCQVKDEEHLKERIKEFITSDFTESDDNEE